MIAALVVSALVVAASPAGADDFVIPKPAGLEAKVIADAADGALSSVNLLDAALVASGVSAARLPAERAKVQTAIAPAIERAKRVDDRAARGKALLRALHDTVFLRYVQTASQVQDVVATGEFNCLSSAVLFVIAADGLLDAPTAMVTRRHAFARVIVDGKPVDVETTTPGGFGVDRRALLTPAYLAKLGLNADQTATPAEILEDLRSPEELPITALVAGLYSNRGVGLVDKGDARGAAVAFDRATRIAKGAMRARIASWRGSLINQAAFALVEQDRIEDAIVLLRLALEGTDGELRAVLTKNLAECVARRGDAAMARKDAAAAFAAYDEAKALGARGASIDDARRQAVAALAAKEKDLGRCDGAASTKTPAAAKETARCLAEAAHALLAAGEPAKAMTAARRARALAPDDDAPKVALFYALAKQVDADLAKRACPSVEAAAREAGPFRKVAKNDAWSPSKAMGACWAYAAQEAAARGDRAQAGAGEQAAAMADASRAYERALVHLDDAVLRTNLARVEARRAQIFVDARRCDEARPLLVRAARLEPELAKTGVQLLEECANLRASDAAKRQDWSTATIEVRRGLKDAPKSDVLQKNLAAMVHNVAGTLLEARRCDEAKALLPDLEAAGDDEAIRAVRACR